MLSAFAIPLMTESAPFDLDDGTFHRAVLTVTPNPADATKALFDLDLIQDVQGAATGFSVMADVAANINLSALPRNRVMAGARALGGSLVADVDNFSVTFVPEPSSATLFALSVMGLLRVFPRRRMAA